MSEGWLFRLRSGLGAPQVAPAWPTSRGASRAGIAQPSESADAKLDADARDDLDRRTAATADTDASR